MWAGSANIKQNGTETHVEPDYSVHEKKKRGLNSCDGS